MSLEAATIALLLKLPIATEDREELEREVRIEVLGRATANAAERATCTGAWAVPGCKRIFGDALGLVARMVAVGEHETLFRRRLHAGECKAWECDARVWHGVRVFLAQGPWQAHKLATLPDVQWRAMVGVGEAPTQAMAWYSTQLFVMQENRCRRGAAGGFAGYATGNLCNWEGAGALVQTAARYRIFLAAHVG